MVSLPVTTIRDSPNASVIIPIQAVITPHHRDTNFGNRRSQCRIHLFNVLIPLRLTTSITQTGTNFPGQTNIRRTVNLIREQ